MIVTPLLFVLLSIALFAIPFLPAWREWRYPTDTSALHINPDRTNNIDHFSDRFSQDVIDKLTNRAQTPYQNFDYLPASFSISDLTHATKPLIAFEAIKTESPIRYAEPFFVNADLTAGNKSVLAAIYTRGALVLGANSEIHRWGHAEGVLRVGANSVVLRRISSKVLLKLDEGCWFERLHAPKVQFGAASSLPCFVPIRRTIGYFAHLPNVVQKTEAIYWIKGDCTLPADHVYTGSLVVTGKLVIGERTTIIGDLKARKGIVIEAHASVGSVTCDNNIHFCEGSYADGPVISEANILVGAHCTIGQPTVLTTITSANIIIEPGVTVHGTVWAKDVGMVRPS